MADRDGPAWVPDSLHDIVSRSNLGRYQYVVLEELIQGSALLIAWPWPEADALGLPRWPELPTEPRETVIDRDILEAQLYRPSRLRRSPRVGDVLAVARLGPGWKEDRVNDVRSLVDGAVYDITVDARAAAKLSYFGALTGQRRPAVVERRALALRDEDGIDEPATRLRTDAPLRRLTVAPASASEGSGR